MIDALTICTPVKEDPSIVEKWLKLNRKILDKYPLVVVDRIGGQVLKDVATHYFQVNSGLAFARRFCVEGVTSPYVLCLDADTVVPTLFPDVAVQLLERNPHLGAIALDYERLQGHLAFGASVWRADLLRILYTWRLEGNTNLCECFYMWNKLKAAGYGLEIPGLMRAKHLKEAP